MLKRDMQKNITQDAISSKGKVISQPEVLKEREAVPRNKEPFSSEKIDIIRDNIIGFNTRYVSPFNIELESVYVDHTATNRPYRTVEDMIKYAKKFAANPHTEFSHFGSTFLLK
jgi:hypothetical protein